MSDEGVIVFALAGLGAIIGSFLNVVALRFISKEDMVSKPSHCPQCDHRLSWLELFPIFSYTLQKAHCRHCSQVISPQYPIIELTTALISLILFWPGNATYPLSQSIIIFITIAILLVLCVIDVRTFLLPDVFIIGLCLLAGIFFLTHITQALLLSSVIGAVIGAGFLWLIWYVTAGRGLGLGDVKLMAPVGFLLGGPGTAICLLLAFIAGGTVGSFLLATKKANMKTAIPFGPFLAGTAILLLLLPNLTPYILRLLGWPL